MPSMATRAAGHVTRAPMAITGRRGHRMCASCVTRTAHRSTDTSPGNAAAPHPDIVANASQGIDFIIISFSGLFGCFLNMT